MNVADQARRPSRHDNRGDLVGCIVAVGHLLAAGLRGGEPRLRIVGQVRHHAGRRGDSRRLAGAVVHHLCLLSQRVGRRGEVAGRVVSEGGEVRRVVGKRCEISPRVQGQGDIMVNSRQIVLVVVSVTGGEPLGILHGHQPVAPVVIPLGCLAQRVLNRGEVSPVVPGKLGCCALGVRDGARAEGVVGPSSGRSIAERVHALGGADDLVGETRRRCELPPLEGPLGGPVEGVGNGRLPSREVEANVILGRGAQLSHRGTVVGIVAGREDRLPRCICRRGQVIAGVIAVGPRPSGVVRESG